jgi:hypothetical protein
LTRFTASHIRLHSSLKKRVYFFEAVDVEFDFAFAFVFHAEVKPLAMAIGI